MTQWNSGKQTSPQPVPLGCQSLKKLLLKIRVSEDFAYTNILKKILSIEKLNNKKMDNSSRVVLWIIYAHQLKSLVLFSLLLLEGLSLVPCF